MQLPNTDDFLLLYLSINRITFLRYSEKKILAKKLDSSRSLALLSIEEILNLTGHIYRKGMIWDGIENLKQAKKALQYCKFFNIKIIFDFSENYPELLRQISDPPFLLFCRGNESLLTKTSVSVVGTRNLTPEGRKASYDFAYDAVCSGLNVVSGLAFGADGYAHQGAVDAFFDKAEKEENTDFLGKTVAVIPSGIDEIIPSGHKRLAGKILQSGGCIVSEYEPALQMANWHFVGRNRIIAALSPATVVVQAPPGSGALITADFALEYNREVMFHKAAFCESAKKIAEAKWKKLESDFASNKISKYKLENTITRFLDCGAVVIEDYKDYCKALNEIPGFRVNQYNQGLLFET